MRDPKRIEEILRKLGYLWMQYPDQRFWQLCQNYLIPPDTTDVWFLEDDEILKMLDELTLKKDDTQNT